VGVSFIDHHDCVFPGQRHHVTPARVFVEFRTSGEGPRNQETLRHVTVYELVPYGVRVVQVGLLKESLDVVTTRPTSEWTAFLSLPSSWSVVVMAPLVPSLALWMTTMDSTSLPPLGVVSLLP
jgi:hypothetical protein